MNKPDVNPLLQNNRMLEVQKQKINQDYEIKKEQNQIKREELELKKAEALANHIEKEN